MNGLKCGIALYTNPIAEKQFTLQMNNLAAGNYYIQLFIAEGKKVFQNMIEHFTGSEWQQIQLPAYLSGGIYNIVVSNSQNKFTEKLVLQ